MRRVLRGAASRRDGRALALLTSHQTLTGVEGQDGTGNGSAKMKIDCGVFDSAGRECAVSLYGNRIWNSCPSLSLQGRQINRFPTVLVEFGRADEARPGANSTSDIRRRSWPIPDGTVLVTMNVPRLLQAARP